MTANTNSETAIFERIVLPRESKLSEQAARSLLEIGFGEEDRERMQILADKAKLGALSPDEEQEIGNYERVGHYVAILQSKARLALRAASRRDS